MKYNFKDTTLLHGILFNLSRFESICKYGIISKKYALENNIDYNKNYEGYNKNDYISMTSVLYVNFNDELSSYHKYIENGISFIVDDVEYEFDKDQNMIHRSDEVLVKNNIKLKNIKGIIIPNKYKEETISSLSVIPINATKYSNIKSVCNDLINYMKKYNYEIDDEEYQMYLSDIMINSNALYKEDSSSPDYKEILFDLHELVQELNDFMALNLNNCLTNYYGKDLTVYEVIEILNKKYLNLEIYSLPNDKIKIK